jgi:nucleoid-associated protein YgaU
MMAMSASGEPEQPNGWQRARSPSIALAVLALAVAVLLPLAILPRLRQQAATQATPTAVPTATSAAPVLFHGNVFWFSYPAGWWEMTPAEVNVLLKTSLKGMTPGQYSYIGGVYSEGLDNCKTCAQVVVMVAGDPTLTGRLSDQQYQALSAANEQALGARLLSQGRTEVASLPAVEFTHLSPGGDLKVWEYLIVPPEPGVAYRLICSSQVQAFAGFEPVFRQAIDTLYIGAAIPTPVPTLTPRSIRTAVPLGAPTPIPTTYTVQPGDVLGVIAKKLGVSVEALAEANGLEDPYIIQPGQVLIVPAVAR